MREKIKIILSNVQMRNMIYLVCGIFFILILFLIYNPKFEYRSFNDIVDECAKYGIKAIIQPGGSIRDQLSIDACNKHGIAMVFTGVRHFKH